MGSFGQMFPIGTLGANRGALDEPEPQATPNAPPLPCRSLACLEESSTGGKPRRDPASDNYT